MRRALIIMGIIAMALVAYAASTAQIPPASVEYTEVFYINNQSVTFVTKDGFGLFTMRISPRVDSFELTIGFPERTSYLIKYGNKSYKGTGEFKITVDKATMPDEVYIQFQLAQDVTEKLIQENGEAEITITGDKMPVWHAEDVIYVKYRKEEKES